MYSDLGMGAKVYGLKTDAKKFEAIHFFLGKSCEEYANSIDWKSCKGN